MNNVSGFTNTHKIKQEAALWLLKIEEESPLSEEQAEALQKWVATSPIHKQVIMQMSHTWQDLDALGVMMRGSDHKTKSCSTSADASGLNLVQALKSRFLTRQLTSRRAVFASVFAIMIMTLLGYSGWTNRSTDDFVPVTYVTSVGQQAQHNLADGSILWLNSNTQVTVNYSVKQRAIHLTQGEAHFQVKSNPDRPFEVFSSNHLVRAIGTAFSVYKLPEYVEVMVSEGRVQLTSLQQTANETAQNQDEKNDTEQKSLQEQAASGSQQDRQQPTAKAKNVTTLSAGQLFSLPVDKDLSKEEVKAQIVRLNQGEIQRKLAWLDGKLIFTGETLREVVTEISRHTNMKIDIVDAQLRDLPIGGHFEVGETEALFRILESGFNIRVKRIDENHVELSASQ